MRRVVQTAAVLGREFEVRVLSQVLRRDLQVVARVKQAEAERERRSKIINAEGEMQASHKLLEAGTVLAQEPQAMQLRYLSGLQEIAGEKNSTIVFPFPMEFIRAFLGEKEPDSND